MNIPRNGRMQSTNAYVPDWIDQSTFAYKLQALYSHWRQNKDELWGSADIFAIATPPNAYDIGYLTSSLNKWLLGYAFPNIVIVFGNKEIHFLCSQKKKAELLEAATRAAKGVVDVDMVIHRCKDGIAKMDDVLYGMLVSDAEVHDAPIIGYIAKESPQGSLLKNWADRLKSFGLLLSDVTVGLSAMLASEYAFEDSPDQDELAPKLNVETVIRPGKRDHASAFKANSKTSKEVIQFDQENKVVLLPIKGNIVRFHVDTVRRVSCLFSKQLCKIRITFHVPPCNSYDVNPMKHHWDAYITEASFGSKDPRHCSKVVLQIQRHLLWRKACSREYERKAGSREYEIAERPMEVFQTKKLVHPGDKFNPLKLSHLSIHPPLGGPLKEETYGTLEAYVNGFRYTTSVCVDIVYANIKHAFFQLGETGKITLLHFQLHNHIMVGNKETKDVQFCVEAFRLVQTLVDATSNMDFKKFVTLVDCHWSQPQFKDLGLKFEQTLDKFGFHGVVLNKASAFIVPTSSCLVELMFPPYLVIPLSEIDIVILERICPGQTDFDMAIVFKDFKRDVMRIDSIPAASFSVIKEWLHTVTDIEYFEIDVNLHWRAIMKTFIDDPSYFEDVGGWGFLFLGL